MGTFWPQFFKNVIFFLRGRGWGCNVIWVVLVLVVCSAVERLNTAGVAYANLCKRRGLVLEFFFLVFFSFSSCSSLPILFLGALSLYLPLLYSHPQSSSNKVGMGTSAAEGCPKFVVWGGDKSPHSAARPPGPRFPTKSLLKQPYHLVQVTSLCASVSYL